MRPTAGEQPYFLLASAPGRRKHRAVETTQVAPPGNPPLKAGPSAPPLRVASVDAYRGLVMFLMMAEVLSLGAVSRALPDSAFWKFLAHHQSHVPWIGCSLHDLIQPSFSFLVGVALPFSLASRLARGQSRAQMLLHAAWRATLLVLLGVFLRSIGRPLTNWTFEDTLSQIGLGYVFLFLLGQRTVRVQWAALGLILIGYWVMFALYSPPPDFAYPKFGVPDDWKHLMTGLQAHWNKNSNFAWACDTWFLNLFPRESEFKFNGGGYSTLSFIPTLGTMILGLIAGGMLRESRNAIATARQFAIYGAAFLLAGWIVGALGLCPVVKRIWTPSWVLFSGGWCFLFLAAFYLVMDCWDKKSWAFPLVVVGMNSIAAYCIAHLFENFLESSLITHFGEKPFLRFGEPFEALLKGVAVLTLYWLILFWMYRRKIFLRI